MGDKYEKLVQILNDAGVQYAGYVAQKIMELFNDNKNNKETDNGE